MSGPFNGQYRRRFTDPRTRPSNERVDPVVEATRAAIERLGRCIDEWEAERDGDAVREAWRVLHPTVPRPRLGDPGE